MSIPKSRAYDISKAAEGLLSFEDDDHSYGDSDEDKDDIAQFSMQDLSPP